MQYGELIREFRIRAHDKDAPYFWDDEDVLRWLNEAQKEAAVRGRLIPERVTVHLIRDEVDYELNDLGMPPLYEIAAAWIDSHHTKRPVRVVSEEWFHNAHHSLDCHNWHHWEFGEPRYVIQYDTSFKVFPRPIHAFYLVLQGYRFPYVGNDLTDSPEINPAHHIRLVDWALYRAFSTIDADGFDPQRVKDAEFVFNQYFGQPVDVDLHRSFRSDEPQQVQAFWVA